MLFYDISLQYKKTPCKYETLKQCWSDLRRRGRAGIEPTLDQCPVFDELLHISRECE